MADSQKIIKELKKAYGTIADEFSQTRQRHWPEFGFFSRFIPDGVKLLDLGCGNGRFFGFLKEKKKLIDYTGVDFCPEFLKIAKQKYPKQDFIEQDITKLDLEKKFDRIVCIAAFHHVPDRKLRKKTLELIYNHLEDDGVFLISVWNLWQLKYLGNILRAIFKFYFSLFRSDPRDLYIPFGKKKVRRYYHAFLPFELRRLLKKAGFSIIASEVSRFNYVFVCKKNLLSTRANPLFVNQKEFEKSYLTTY